LRHSWRFVCDLIRQVAVEHEIAILSVKLASNDIHLQVTIGRMWMSAGSCNA